MTNPIHHEMIMPDHLANMRLDLALSKLLPEYSRTQIQEWIKNACIFVNGKPAKSKTLMKSGEKITINAVLKEKPTLFTSSPIPLNIIHEDNAILIIHKPVGLVVHPGAGNTDNTLLNALLHHAEALKELPRAGIIHRLDKNTSGVLVVAKTRAALTHLSRQLKKRTISRTYQAIVKGLITSGGTIDEPIGRHPVLRKNMAVIDTGKPARTHYRVMERYKAYTRIKIQLETGRTHQIRVHMAHIHHPILGDPTYGGRLQLPKGASPELIDILRQFKHQALHAYELSFIHPITQKIVAYQAPIPEDMQTLIDCLKEDMTHGK